MAGLVDIVTVVTEVCTMVREKQANNQFAKLLYQRLAETVLPLEKSLPKDHPANRKLNHLYKIAREIRDYIDMYNGKGGCKTFFFAGKYKSEFERLNGYLLHAKADLAVALSLPFTPVGKAEADEDQVATDAMENRLYVLLQESNWFIRAFLDLSDEEKKNFLEKYPDFNALQAQQKEEVLEDIRTFCDRDRDQRQPISIARRIIAGALNRFNPFDFWIPSHSLSPTSKWEKLGRGSFGTVYRGDLMNSSSIAIKVLDAAVTDGTRQERIDYDRETKILRRLQDSRNTVTFVGCTKIDIDGKRRDALIMEYCANGSLADLLYTDDMDKMLLPAERIDALVQIARGMKDLVAAGITHRDLKSNNILVTANKSMKIADFGLATTRSSVLRLSGRKFEAKGTLPWMAPEIVEASESGTGMPHEIYGESSDVYSFGVLCYEVMTGEQPFRNCNETEMTARIRNGKHPNVNPDDDSSPAPMRNLIAFCCSQDVSKRPMFVQVVKILEAIQQEEDPFAPPPPKPVQLPQPMAPAQPPFPAPGTAGPEAMHRHAETVATPSSSYTPDDVYGRAERDVREEAPLYSNGNESRKKNDPSEPLEPIIGGREKSETERQRGAASNRSYHSRLQELREKKRSGYRRWRAGFAPPSVRTETPGQFVLDFQQGLMLDRGIVSLARQPTEEWKLTVSRMVKKVEKWHRDIVVVSALQDAMKDIDRAWFFPKMYGGCATGSIAESEKRWEEFQHSSGKSILIYKDQPLYLSSGVIVFAPRVQIASITAAQGNLQKPSLRILDVGCKFGFTTALLARAARPPDGKVECIGIDHDDEHVRLATAAINWACPELVSRVQFLKKDDYILNDSKGFDIIHSSVVILEDNLGDFRLMLKPHGELVGLVQRNGKLRLEKHVRLPDGFKADIIAEA